MNDQNFASAESSPVGDNVGRQTSNRRARWLIIAVLLVLALGLGGWLVWQYWSAAVPTLSPTTDLASPAEPSPTPPTPATPIYGSEDESGVDTSNWQTYRNEKYGFEFKYPFSHTVKEENDGKNTVVFASDQLTLGVFVVEEQSGLGVNEYNLRFSGNGELFKKILSTFRFIE